MKPPIISNHLKTGSFFGGMAVLGIDTDLRFGVNRGLIFSRQLPRCLRKPMAHTPSAKKRVRQNLSRRAHNRAYRTKIRSQRKQILTLAAAGKKKDASEMLSTFVKTVQQIAGKGLIHRNKAANLISGVAKRINAS